MPEAVAGETPCPECGGRGWVVSPDGGAGTARPCECRRPRLAARLLEGARIPPLYRSKRLSNFKTSKGGSDGGDQLFAAHRRSQGYVDDFLTLEGRFTDRGLVYVGPTGCGKTHLAVAVLIALIERYRVKGCFVEVTSLIQDLQASFDPSAPASRQQILDPVLGADILVLDELGSQKPTPWVLDLLYYLINSRYMARRPTLFTTNFALDEPGRARPRAEENLDRGADPAEAQPRLGLSLTYRLGASLVSRLHEMAVPVVMDAVTDFRREVRSTALRG
jgi:DNA replication protein DnaC